MNEKNNGLPEIDSLTMAKLRLLKSTEVEKARDDLSAAEEFIRRHALPLTIGALFAGIVIGKSRRARTVARYGASKYAKSYAFGFLTRFLSGL